MQLLSRLSPISDRKEDHQNPLLSVLVNTVTWILSIGLVLGILARIFLPVGMIEDWPVEWIAALLLWTAAIYFLNCKGRSKLAGILLNVGLWGLVNYRAWVLGGIDAPIFLANILILFSAGLMLGLKAAFINIVMTLIWAGFLLWDKMAGAIPQPVLKETALAFIFSNIAIFGLSSGILLVTVYYFRIYFKRTQTNSARYRMLFDESANGIVILNDQFQIVIANAAASEILGYETGELIGKVGLELIDREEHERLREFNQKKALPANFSLRGELTLFDKTGRRINTLGSFHPLPGGEYQFIFTDISERRQFETRLREQEEGRSLIFENNPYQITLNEYDTGIFRDANRSFCEFYGFSKDEVIGKTPNQIDILVDPLSLQKIGDILVKQGHLFEEEVLTKNKNGYIFNMAISTHMIAIGEKQYALTTWTDITLRKKAEWTLKETLEQTLEGWARAIEMRDDDTGEHGRRVVSLTERLADRLKVSAEDHMHLRHGAILHDIGKLGVPDHILRKKDALDPAEWEIIKKHPENARRFFSGIPYLREASVIPYYHHENWDGSGYPNGLKGEEIPLAARIFKLADEWDAITNDRPYHKALNRREAAAYIQEQSGKRFDPAIVPVFIRLMLETHQLTLEESQQ
jgi:PAS domain S-box-containing protein